MGINNYIKCKFTYSESSVGLVDVGKLRISLKSKKNILKIGFAIKINRLKKKHFNKYESYEKVLYLYRQDKSAEPMKWVLQTLIKKNKKNTFRPKQKKIEIAIKNYKSSINKNRTITRVKFESNSLSIVYSKLAIIIHGEYVSKNT